jgi:predicted amidohydrolase
MIPVMKLCVAQIKSVKGDIANNISHHIRLADIAVKNEVDVIIFPELSLTGYEQEIAGESATTQDDERFDVLQKISDEHNIVIGVGMPTKTTAGNCISMILFQQNRSRQIYSKQYIHADEEAFFIGGQNASVVIDQYPNIALAICYELFVPEHSSNAFNTAAKIYIASTAKSAKGVEKAHAALPGIAGKYGMLTLFSNGVGACTEFTYAGGTAIWDEKGVLLGRLDDNSEGLLMIDTVTQKVTEEII